MGKDNSSAQQQNPGGNPQQPRRPIRDHWLFVMMFDSTDRSMATASLFAAITGLIVAVIAFCQLWETRSSSEQNERAYVYAQVAQVVNFAGNQPPEVYILIKNTGKTPAVNVRQKAVITVRKFPSPERFDDIGQFIAEVGATVIHPGAAHFLLRRMNGTPAAGDYAQVIRERHLPTHDEAAIYVAGRIDYDDIFKTGPHFTEFCFLFFGHLDKTVPGHGYNAGQTRSCETHNRADDQK